MAPIPADPAPEEPVEVVAEAATVEVAVPVTTPAPTVPPPAPASAPTSPPPLLQAPAELPQVATPGPATRVHAHRLVATSPKLHLTPSQAVRLASDGRDVLTRVRPRAG